MHTYAAYAHTKLQCSTKKPEWRSNRQHLLPPALQQFPREQLSRPTERAGAEEEDEEKPTEHTCLFEISTKNNVHALHIYAIYMYCRWIERELL